jgi:hypothetical protein
MVRRKKRVQHIPQEWVEEVRLRVKDGREFQHAVLEVLAVNAQLDGEYAAGQRSLRRRVLGSVGKRLAQSAMRRG